jgi:hypothetical protein
MRHRSAEFWTYLAGVALLGLSYEWLKSRMPWQWFLAVVFVYLIALRFLGRALAGPKVTGRDEDER